MSEPGNYTRAYGTLRKIRDVKRWLTPRQRRTLRGQALSGDVEGAEKGLCRILEERGLHGKHW